MLHNEEDNTNVTHVDTYVSSRYNGDLGGITEGDNNNKQTGSCKYHEEIGKNLYGTDKSLKQTIKKEITYRKEK